LVLGEYDCVGHVLCTTSCAMRLHVECSKHNTMKTEQTKLETINEQRLEEPTNNKMEIRMLPGR
jgi:hypothetical protein